MTRWAMVADLRRCVGCQTCTAACKHANAHAARACSGAACSTSRSANTRTVQRAFVPVGCMHCDDPPCMHVCPSTATRKRADGIVTIDYPMLCIGCALLARVDRGPYDEPRYKVTTACVAPSARSASSASTRARAKGLTPGVDPEATPACVNCCIAKALHFGDAEDPQSNVSQLLAENQHFRMNEELGTGPGFYYLWDKAP